MGTCPIGFNDASLRAACRRRGVETSVAHESEDRVLVASVHTLVFEDFGCADAVGIAGLGLCGFHYLNRATIARRRLPLPIASRGKSKPFDSMKRAFNVAL